MPIDECVHILAGDANLEESLLDVLRVPAVDGEGERRPSSPRFSHSWMTSPTNFAVSQRSASSPSWKSPAIVRTPARSGSDGANARNGVRTLASINSLIVAPTIRPPV